MTVLATTLRKHGIAVSELARQLTTQDGNHPARATVSRAVNHGVLPLTIIPDFVEQVERCLLGRNINTKGIWVTKAKAPAKGEGNATSSEQENDIKEAAMLTPAALRNYKLVRNPFMDDVRERSDVYLGESHRYAEACMMDAASNGGFMAVCGECGAGKSVLRRKLIDQLQHDGQVRVIYPQIPDKSKMTSAMILESIVGDLQAGAKLKRSHEARARQVRDVLVESASAGMRHVLIIEEAHDLSVPTMKQLKRLWEIEDGFRKVLGIIMIGQTELQHRLNRQTHPEMREVILRCLMTELLPLDRDLEAYVAHKFQRVGINHNALFTGDWVQAIRQRLTAGGRNYMYPLYINNLLAAAMNKAAAIGETRIDGDVIKEA